MQLFEERSMIVLENACKFKEYLGSVFDEMEFYGNFEVVDNNIHLNIIPKDNNDLPTKEQVLEKLKEIMLKKKKQELESQINAICKEKIIKGFSLASSGYFNFKSLANRGSIFSTAIRL